MWDGMEEAESLQPPESSPDARSSNPSEPAVKPSGQKEPAITTG
jgi:hypothetical protein